MAFNLSLYVFFPFFPADVVESQSPQTRMNTGFPVFCFTIPE